MCGSSRIVASCCATCRVVTTPLEADAIAATRHRRRRRVSAGERDRLADLTQRQPLGLAMREDPRVVGADRHHRRIEWTEAPVLAEDWRHRGVTGDEEPTSFAGD